MKNSFKIYIRNLKRQKLNAFITIVGFAISLSVCMLLISYVHSEYSYDKSIPESEKIYRLLREDNYALVPSEAKNIGIENFPEIESATSYFNGEIEVNRNNEVYTGKLVNTDSKFFEFFSIPFYAGNSKDIFADKYNVVITKSAAQRIFGSDNPIGQILNFSHRFDLKVAGIVEDLPDNFSIRADFFCCADLKIMYAGGSFEGQHYVHQGIFFKIKEHSDIKVLSEDITKSIKENTPKIFQTKHSFYLFPFTEMYFSNSIVSDYQEHANVKIIFLLGWLAIILLCFAIFNYLNLNIATVLTRFKEFGILQTVGAGKKTMFFSLILEAFYTTSISFLLALILNHGLSPVFENLLQKEIQLNLLFKNIIPVSILSFVLIGVSILAGIVPALISLKISPTKLLKNSMGRIYSAYNVRKVLNVLQFSLTVVVIFSLIIIAKQLNFVKHSHKGFDDENIVIIPVHFTLIDKAPILKEQLLGLSEVKKVTYSLGIPGEIYTSSNNEENIRVSHIFAEFDFIDTYELTLVEGRSFYPNEKQSVCLINEYLMKQYGWNTFEGKTIFGSEVIGVIQDFHFQDMYHPIGAFSLVNENDMSHISVRILPRSDISSTLKKMEDIILKIAPDFKFSFHFYDTWINNRYHEEERKVQAIKLLAAIAILIACLGLFGLADYTIKKKTKEIGLRKVNGAKTAVILTLITSEYLVMVCSSFIIGCPIGWFIMQKWLENFAYKTPIHWWVFALSGILVFLIVIVTVSFQTWRAARKNPVEALRYE